MSPQKISLVILRYFPFGGLQQSFINILLALQKRGFCIDVITMNWQGDRPDGITIHEYPQKSLTNHGKIHQFAQSLSDHKKNTVDSIYIGFNRLPGLDIYYAGDVCYREYILKERPFWVRWTSRYKTLASIENTIFSTDSKTHIFCISEREKNIYQKHYQTPDARILVLKPGIRRALDFDQKFLAIERETVRSELNILADDYVLLMVGSDFNRKGVARSIQALAALPLAILQKTHLVVIGQGHANRLIQLSKKLGILNQVHFTGGIAHPKVCSWMRSSDLLLHPAHHENTGNVLLEALTYGLGVLASNNCGYAPHITAANAGALIENEPFIQIQFNTLLQNILNQPEKIKQWSLAALEYANHADLYSRLDQVANWLETWQKP